MESGTPSLADQLQQKGSEPDLVCKTYDAFLLDAGLGPPTYLSRDGRIVWHDDDWGVRGTLGEAYVAIAAGIRKTGVTDLRTLLPTRDPVRSIDCLSCDGTGLFTAHGQLKDVRGKPMSLICTDCAGLGWEGDTVDLAERVLDVIADPTCEADQ